MIDLETIDVIKFLDSEGIEYKEKGKNVTRGWVNIQCPFCGDPSNHCGINLNSKLFHCWKCEEKGNIIKLAETLLDISFPEAKRRVGAFSDETFAVSDPEERPRANRLILPGEDLQKCHRDYLTGRQFDPDFLIKKYNLKGVYNIGEYRFRIIVPVFVNHRPVSFVAMDILRNDPDRPKYLNCPPEKSVIPNNSCLYNADTVKDTAVILEGITDVWRMGDGFVSSFRKDMTPEQIQFLIHKKPKRVFVMYDYDAIKQSISLAQRLSGIFPHVEVLSLDEGDPAELEMEEVMKLRYEIFNKEGENGK